MRRPDRLAARLVMTTVLVLAVVLILMGGLSLFLAARAYETSVDGELRNTASEVVARLQERPEGPVEILDELSTPSKYLEILDRYGQVQLRSTNLGVATIPLDPEKALKDRNTFHTTELREHKIRVVAHPSGLGEPSPTYVIVAEDVLDSDKRLFQLAGILLGTASLGLLVGSAGMIALVRRETRPLRALTDELRTASNSGFDSPISAMGSGSLETRELRTALSQLVEGQHQLLARERAFFADSSHVLRTPMAVLQGAMERIEAGASQAEQESALEQARVALDTMARSVSGLLLLSREGPDNPITWEAVDLEQLLSELGVQARASNATLEIDLNVAPGLVVAGDRDQLRALFASLVENAVQYTPPGGSVLIAASETDGDAVVRIQDSGIGIPAGELHRVLERFYRGSNARSRRSDGTGLGLPIALRVADLHNGSLTLAAVPNGGTLAEVRLPLIG